MVVMGEEICDGNTSVDTVCGCNGEGGRDMCHVNGGGES